MSTQNPANHKHTYGYWCCKDSTFHIRTCSQCGHVEEEAHSLESSNCGKMVIGETYSGGVYWDVYGDMWIASCRKCAYSYDLGAALLE
jgi:hypothetical protein